MVWVSVLTTVGCALGAVVLLAVAVRLIPSRWREDDTIKNSVDHFNGINKTLFSFILALSIVSAWGSLSKAEENVTAEATGLVNLYWISRPLPDAQRERIRELTRQYITVVIDEEWPLMAKGEVSPRAQQTLDDLRRTVQDAEVSTGRQESLVRDGLSALREVFEARRMRILMVSTEIPGYLWIGLIASAALVVIASAVQIPSLTIPGVVSIAILAALLASVLILISALNHPFGGGIHTEPDALVLILERFKSI